MNNKKIFLSIFLILFLVSISAVSADENSTDLEIVSQAMDDIEEIPLTVEDTVNIEDDASDIVSASEDNEKLGIDIEGDVYFDASATSDGDGSKNSPFKYVTPDRLPYGCTAYFKDGVYEISSTCSLKSNDGSAIFDVPTKVTFIGESTTGTIFKGINSSAVAFKVNDNSRFYAYNMTFDNAVVQNNGRFEAYGVIFKNGVAVDIYASYYNPPRNNAFGGAIYSPGSNYYLGYGMKSYLTIVDCLFMDNSAVYGGSIYHKYGDTIIRNTKFINSFASLYGGVLATDGGSILIENCDFLNCHAAGDAGGAIYSKVTNLTVKNSNFTNGLGDFGGAICNLNSDLIIENCNFYNNTAKLEGGAIYAMYGTVLIKNSNIVLSSALDGGALFVDNCSSVNIKDTKFDKSNAIRYGGTIFSNGKPVSPENVTILESSAAIGPIVYHQDKYDYDIGYNSNYTLMRYNSSYRGVLPSRYDLREENGVTPVKDQQAGGNCWAFAGIAALESCIKKATGKDFDLSEENVKNLVELYSAYGWKYDTNEGGHSEMTWGHLISWLGPVLEEQDIYDDYSTLSTLFDAVMHVQNVYYLPPRQNALDNDAIKKAIMDYGGISVGIYWTDDPLNWNEQTSSFFLASSTKGYANHAVCIVGWDDNYDKNNFAMKYHPDLGNGAWIVKNSWGSDWGDNGYFYVSYYDPVVCKIGEKNDVFTFILNDTQRYNRNYQYDIGGMTDFLYPIGNNKTVYYKNVFTSKGNEILSAFSTIFEDETDFEVKLFINDALKLTQKGHSFAGYATIPFNTEFLLNSGDKFEIEIKITRDGGASFPICEIVTATRLTYSDGISFFSTDGKTWTDLYNFVLDRPDIEHRYGCQVACIKAFTKSTGVVMDSYVTVADVEVTAGKSATISAIVKDSNGKLINTGVVTFDVNGLKETVKVENGIAVLEKVFDNIGTFDIKVSYDGGEVYKNSNNAGKLTVKKDDNVSSAKSTKIIVNNAEYVSGNVNVLKVKLTDADGNAIADADLKVKIGGNTLSAKTNNDGIANFNINLGVGEYTALTEFAGNSKYLKSEASSKIKITAKPNFKTVISSDMTRAYGSGKDFEAKFLDENGNPLKNSEVTFIINGNDYNVKTDKYGNAKLNAKLAVGTFKITSINPATGEKRVNTVKIVKRITENKDLTMDYLSGAYYKVRVYGDNGKPVGAGEIVVMKVCGKTYNVKTDKNGYAKLPINLLPKSHKITVSYKGSTVSNKIVVKQVLKTKNYVVSKKTKSIKVYAVLKNSKGIAIKNKKLTFKFLGKTYSAKTNAKGIATIFIKNTYKPGKYAITTTYVKTTLKNTIQIKR